MLRTLGTANTWGTADGLDVRSFGSEELSYFSLEGSGTAHH